MKKLIIILTLFMSTIGFTQEKVNDSLNTLEITQAERIIDKYSSKIAESFNEGLNKVAPVAEQGFEIAVKLQIAKGIVNILPIIGFILFFMYFNNEYKKISNDDNRRDINRGPFDEDNVTPQLIVSGILTIILFIGGFICTFNGITHLIAPEWFAIKEIIELF